MSPLMRRSSRESKELIWEVIRARCNIVPVHTPRDKTEFSACSRSVMGSLRNNEMILHSDSCEGRQKDAISQTFQNDLMPDEQA